MPTLLLWTGPHAAFQDPTGATPQVVPLVLCTPLYGSRHNHNSPRAASSIHVPLSQWVQSTSQESSFPSYLPILGLGYNT